MPEPFFTIGHSTRSLEDFAALLGASQVSVLVDVRTIPRSRTNPQYNQETLPGSLEPLGVAYQHIRELGGRRPRQREIPPERNAYWTQESFHNYADYACTRSFRSGFEQLQRLGEERRCAIMCSEAVWWRCHRRIITDYLIASGEAVLHILGGGRVDTASLTPGAVREPDGTLRYPKPGESLPLL